MYKGIAVMAGYGIKGLLVTQDLPALEEVYGQHTAIWGNTDLKIFHAPTNDLTAKRISENLMGRGTMEHPVESHGHPPYLNIRYNFLPEPTHGIKWIWCY